MSKVNAQLCKNSVHSSSFGHMVAALVTHVENSP